MAQRFSELSGSDKADALMQELAQLEEHGLSCKKGPYDTIELRVPGGMMAALQACITVGNLLSQHGDFGMTQQDVDAEVERFWTEMSRLPMFENSPFYNNPELVRQSAWMQVMLLQAKMLLTVGEVSLDDFINQAGTAFDSDAGA